MVKRFAIYVSGLQGYWCQKQAEDENYDQTLITLAFPAPSLVLQGSAKHLEVPWVLQLNIPAKSGLLAVACARAAV